jgi:uncharacterized protein (DUF433 family)
LIIKTPGVVGGRARIAGTRISVECIAVGWKGSSVETILQNYPTLSRTLVDEARAYAEAHPEEFNRQPWPPVCDRCGDVLEEPGGIYLGRPNHKSECVKRHLCVTCDESFGAWIGGCE